MEDGSEILQTFKLEAEELLVSVEECVLDIEDNPRDQDAINRLFRAVHTIKGSGSMFGYMALAAFTHHLESVLDKVRSGLLPIDRHLIDLVLDSRDLIKGMLEGDPSAPAEDQVKLNATVASLAALCDHKAAETEKNSDQEETVTGMRTIRIRFQPNPSTFRQGMDPACILDELRELGTCDIRPLCSSVPGLQDFDPHTCYIGWEIDLTTEASPEDLRSVFIFVEDDAEISMETLEDLPVVEETEVKPVPAVVEIVEAKAELSAAAVAEPASGAKRKVIAEGESVRVASDKLDKLINLIGELVITQAQLAQVASSVENHDLATPVEGIERLVAELRDVVLSVRMMPIGSTFNRFRRLVRDLSAELGKEIELVTEGAETEMDKGVIDRLADPLVHLIRNCVDHGIEPPAERVAKGKPAKGRIRLVAAHRGTNVVISVEDDGKGLDSEAIRRKAIEKGLISADAQLSRKEAFDLIFMPGFSTASQITNVSGRGVGMDVVRREIDGLRGNIEVESETDHGSVMHLSLPLTLAIIDGLLVEVSASEFVIPLSTIEECLELDESHFPLGSGRNVIQVRGEALPCVFLREFFHLASPPPTIQEAVVARVGNSRVAVVVDHVVGDHQTVIKSLGKVYQDVQGVSGATIMGDGQVALILDVDQIVRSAEKEELAALSIAVA